jgi:hypothetical protein
LAVAAAIAGSGAIVVGGGVWLAGFGVCACVDVVMWTFGDEISIERSSVEFLRGLDERSKQPEGHARRPASQHWMQEMTMKGMKGVDWCGCARAGAFVICAG